MIWLADHERVLPLRFLRAWNLAPFDIAVLAFGIPDDWPDEHRWTVPAIDLLPPKVGTQVAAFGFPNSRFQDRGADSTPSVLLDPRSSTGDVLEVHHRIRDSVRMPFPCFRTNARFDGGMSGAPVFNNRTGMVCGMVCSSFPSSDDEEHISYASTLWPMLATMIDATDSQPSGAAPYPFARLYERGVLKAANREFVVISTSPNAVTIGTSYDASNWILPRD